MARKDKKPKKKKSRPAARASSKPKRGGPAQAEASEKPAAAAKLAPNPYDVFQNRRRRRAVLGERVRGERRDLVRSRASAASERTKGLLRESLGSRRTSRFKDARLGEQGDGMGDSRSNVQRLVRLRQKEARKSFALGANEELSIRGRPLSTVPDEELRREGREPGEGSDDEAPPTMDGGIDDLVAKSKLQKLEAARLKDEQERALGRLDEGYRDILGQLSFRPPKALAPKEPSGDNKDPEGYDRLLKELAFERKVVATERVKSPEEIALEQAEKLAELERARAARAAGMADIAGVVADEVIDEGPGEFGQPQRPSRPAVEELEPAAPEGEEGSEEEGEEEDREGSEEEEGEEAEEEDDGVEAGGADAEEDEDDRCGEDCITLLTSAEAGTVDIMANAPGEERLPFAPACPSDRRAVDALIGTHPPRTALKLVQRVRACTAVALSTGNVAKLKAFFVALLDYVVHVVARSDGDISARGMQILYALRKPLLEMANDYPAEAQAFFSARLAEMGPQTLPRALELSYLKLAVLLFPVTDFRHPVLTPMALLADHWAARLAALGAGIAELVSEALLLWELLYELVVVGEKFCSAFFLLGGALLESCAASAAAGRTQCAEALVDISALLVKALRALESADQAAARVAGEELVRPALSRLAEALERLSGPARESLDTLTAELDRIRAGGEVGGLVPLALFVTERPQIRMLDPIFHETGDRPLRRGMEVSESKQLQRSLNTERRHAARQLARDALALQQLQGQKDAKRRVSRLAERARVRTIMEVEKQEIKKMMTEVDGMMDTSLHRYSANKDRKKANKRMGGSATADTVAAKAASGTVGERKRKADTSGAAPAPAKGARGAKAQKRRANQKF